MPWSIIRRTVGVADRQREQLEQFVGDALARERHQIIGARGTGRKSGRVRLARAEPRLKAWKKRGRIRR